MTSILIVDDEKTMRVFLREVLTSKGFFPVEASDGKEAIEVFKKEKPCAVLLDLRIPDMDGIATMQELKKIDSEVPIIIVTGQSDIETAVDTIKLGAYDFILKPPKVDRLIHTIKRAVEKFELGKSARRSSEVIEGHLEGLFGKSSLIKEVIEQIKRVAQSDFSVIIQGETGVGKSVVARAIHNLSDRVRAPFISVDIGAIPETIIESELFGYEKGAFTGAQKRKTGFFEIANEGTIFIDELQNISPFVQGKLLRVVEEKKIYPLGSTTPVAINVRIIAATNTDIRQAVKEKRFREDLFFRLGEFFITVPPLRERVEDIPALAQRFFREAASELNKQMLSLSDEAINILKSYHWHGNIRELKNIIRRAVLISDTDTVEAEHLEFLISEKGRTKDELPLVPLKELSAMAVRDVEEKAIKKVLAITKGNKTKAASILKIDYKTLLTKIKDYSIQ